MKSSSGLVDRALDTNYALLALGHETFESDGATFVRSRETPEVWDSNHMSQVTVSAPEEIERLLTRAKREYEGVDRISFEVDYRTPPELAARLCIEGYEEEGTVLLLLEGELKSSAKEVEIRPVESEEDWERYSALQAMDWEETRTKAGLEADPGVAEALMRARRKKSPAARFWMAYVDGEPRSYLYSWEGTNGVGQVEELFTHPEFRHQGLATALIHHCVADVREHGAGPVVIAADPEDTPKVMYAAMGFRPVAMKRTWRSSRAGSQEQVAGSK